MLLRVLTWNLKHGRAVPSAGRDLFEEFAAALAAWDWDVALLQEVPPWWPPMLGRRLDAESRLVLTSRNWAPSARRAIATRWPDAISSNGGGANAVLVRGTGIVDSRALRLALVPERRWLHAVRLALPGGVRGGSDVWLGNVHLTGSLRGAAARSEARAAADAMLGWSDGGPALLGGDFNLERLSLPGFELVGSSRVDHLLAHGLEAPAPSVMLDRGVLSDHAPVVATVRPTEPRDPARDR